MSAFTVSISEDIMKRLAEHPDINWPEYLRQKIELRLNELVKFEQMRHGGKF
jgi:predicted GIY-YIG superfamily endonuclease